MGLVAAEFGVLYASWNPAQPCSGRTPAMTPDRKEKNRFIDVIMSVAAAAFGVQSGKNRERDFSSGSPGRYVIVGIVATAVFVLTMFVIVKVVLRAAGA